MILSKTCLYLWEDSFPINSDVGKSARAVLGTLDEIFFQSSVLPREKTHVNSKTLPTVSSQDNLFLYSVYRKMISSSITLCIKSISMSIAMSSTSNSMSSVTPIDRQKIIFCAEVTIQKNQKDQRDQISTGQGRLTRLDSYYPSTHFL